MAYTKKTLADLKQSLADRHDGGELPTESATLSLDRLLNKGQAYCTDKLRLTKSKDYTTSSGTIALDDDFLSVARVVDSNGNQLVQIGKEDNALATGLYFWISGNHFDGFALNTPDDETYTVYYSFRPAEMSENTDECIIPDPEAVVAYAYSFLRKSETDPIGDSQQSLEECDIRLNEIISSQNINDGGLSLQFNA